MDEENAKIELKKWIVANASMDSALFDYKLHELILSLSHKVVKNNWQGMTGHTMRQYLRKELKCYSDEVRFRTWKPPKI